MEYRSTAVKCAVVGKYRGKLQVLSRYYATKYLTVKCSTLRTRPSSLPGREQTVSSMERHDLMQNFQPLFLIS